MTDARKPPDLFTPDEAAEYLHVTVVTLDTLRRNYRLRGYSAGKSYVYWRADLDDCALRIVGIEPPSRVERRSLRLAD
jgi:hypothetical protein